LVLGSWFLVLGSWFFVPRSSTLPGSGSKNEDNEEPSTENEERRRTKN
jgi:hypothetical protein